MALSLVTITWDETDIGQGGLNGSIRFAPNTTWTDTLGHTVIEPQPLIFPVLDSAGQTTPLVANDSAGLLPSGSYYVITVQIAGLPPRQFNAYINFANGSSQTLGSLNPLVTVPAQLAYLPLPSGTPSAGQVPVATGSGELSAWGTSGGAVDSVNGKTGVVVLAASDVGAVPSGATVVVAAPTGATAADTPAVEAAITALATALASGPVTLLFQDGTYQIDSNSAVIRSVSNFTVRGTGRTAIEQAPNRTAFPNNTAGDLFIIADCTDFRVDGITFDCNRDAVAPITPITASASSGQPSVTVASGHGANYVVGQGLAIFGGIGSADQNLSDGFAGGGGITPLIISSIIPGGGSGGGDLITFTTNLAHSYTQTGGTAVSDGFGPYAWTSDYLTPYQCGHNNSVAGRTLSGEDQQNGLHLISCKRFTITQVTARNTWESQIKCGTGFAASSLTDGCQQGTISDCTVYHGYDQGISLWVSKNITVTGCVANASGWAGISLSGSDDCTVTANQILGSVYQIPGDLSNGFGVAIEGGLHNQVKGNIITGTYCAGIELDASPMPWGTFNTLAPTLGAFLEELTPAGTSVLLSATSALEVGGLYSIIDGPRTEAVTIASIIDGTHVTFSGQTWFSHASGLYVAARAGQENVIEGNTIFSSQFGAAIVGAGAARTVIKSNVIRNWAGLTTTGDGISLIFSKAEAWPAGAVLGGDGSHIEGNTIGGSGYSSGHCIHADSVTGLMIRGNRLYGGGANAALMYLQGVTDSVVSGNFVSDTRNAGISTALGTESSTVPARIVLDGNRVMRCGSAGMFLQAGDSLTITANVVSACAGNAGIDLQGITNSVVDGNVANANQAAGILLENNGSSVGCSGCRVTNNTARDDGSGYNTKTGATWTQQNGITESGASNSNLFTGNEIDSNAVAQLTTEGAATLAWANIISGAVTGALPGALVAAATTSAQGAVQLDGTAGDIQPIGTQSAGNKGQAADAKHVHAWGQAAPASFTPPNPAGTASTSLVMMGFGALGTSPVLYTPAGSGIVLVQFACYVGTATASVAATVGPRFGTGTPPVSGAAVSGTRFGAVGDIQTRDTQVAQAGACVTASAVLSLTPGTTYWFDLALETGNTSDTASMVNASFSFAELP